MNDLPVEIEAVPTSQITWRWNDPPLIQLSRFHNVIVDPIPAYAHDLDVVTETVELVTGLWRPEGMVKFFVMPVEGTDRVNAHASYRRQWEPGEPDAAEIVLFAKRTPIHPAVTRYLVAHEYGHIVQRWVQQALGHDVEATVGFLAYYAELRGIEATGHAMPGTWHRSVSEIFANDFRVLATGVEPEFWPHPGISFPTETPAAVAFWNHAMEFDYTGVAFAPEES